MDTDIRIENHGSIVLFRPITEIGKEWIDRTSPEDAQFFGPAMVVEPRYVAGVVDAAREEGLTLGEM